ncbi:MULTISPECIES: hypothetical protein [Streptomyces]|uniref:Uncharacterized protein n=1 Tax=Streptomyces flavovirens TaxID=52258 RepID=A0ABV8NBR2_9ACTN|nr:hypothetical protein [Streptomyces sp. MBT51]MBK3594833.1 hypothetical protein [Streptomyces sp. MBT51]
MSALRPGDITAEMIQAMDAAKRQGPQKDLRALAANIRADAEGRYDSAEPGWALPLRSGHVFVSLCGECQGS